MKKYFVILFFVCVSLNYSQLILEENFDYPVGDSLSHHNWTIYKQGDGGILIEDYNLTFPNYPSISGNSIKIDTSGVDYYRSLGQEYETGTFYLSFLINVQQATTAQLGSDIIGFANNSTTSPFMAGKLFLKKYDASRFLFGISKTTDTVEFTDSPYLFNETYLVVIKYILNSGSGNDQVSLFIFENEIPQTEPEPDIRIDSAAGNEPANISVVALRQDITTNKAYIDGIRVSTSWSEAPLPVEMAFFRARSLKNKIILSWETVTELNNYGFEVERFNCSGNESWQKIGFVHGHGNSYSPKFYYFEDIPENGIKFKYRLKQIDFDGTFKFYESEPVELNQESYAELKVYPNPFNSWARIKYFLPGNESRTMSVKLAIYSLNGELVEILTEKDVYPGYHTVYINSSNYSSGVYFIVLSTDDYFVASKCTILK
ncbi:T9SS type A sorting domain-containing protein [Melioribacter sp. OK-6-Me]|uniref:T9SS type A sorting domain-containing protein n=1 Tax=unclassified Melioribacter TaxID=2627329 RepID=UPI003ED9E2DC